jgi:hypothetical protein
MGNKPSNITMSADEIHFVCTCYTQCFPDRVVRGRSVPSMIKEINEYLSKNMGPAYCCRLPECPFYSPHSGAPCSHYIGYRQYNDIIQTDPVKARLYSLDNRVNFPEHTTATIVSYLGAFEEVPLHLTIGEMDNALSIKRHTIPKGAGETLFDPGEEIRPNKQRRIQNVIRYLRFNRPVATSLPFLDDVGKVTDAVLEAYEHAIQMNIKREIVEQHYARQTRKVEAMVRQMRGDMYTFFNQQRSQTSKFESKASDLTTEILKELHRLDDLSESFHRVFQDQEEAVVTTQGITADTTQFDGELSPERLSAMGFEEVLNPIDGENEFTCSELKLDETTGSLRETTMEEQKEEEWQHRVSIMGTTRDPLSPNYIPGTAVSYKDNRPTDE